MEFTAAVVLGSARTTRTGDFFIIQGDTFFSINKYTFDQFAAGNYESITFEEAGMMPVTNNADGTARPQLKATKITKITPSTRLANVQAIDTAKLKVELGKVKKEAKELDIDI